ncbi:hypothetical protein [Corynebacterium liangguodongii]|uniref:Uncharacterized protein n=1 Tax=Corynebacterium liangguodongii TaxID=2079535 RepID=A0A2S0WD20_9CORY|nr:hypothetical protein [Corynebacterium liangguodongii]AWB83572.1 hypothetical protein C3E79_02940 [Corynebacterium liangguodongii]PWC00338.1 hypothetical protein DF219_00010 [Corynebacterium liangguodongii]
MTGCSCWPTAAFVEASPAARTEVLGKAVPAPGSEGIYHYIAAGTADDHAWSTLKYKQDFIQQIYQGTQAANSLDVDDDKSNVLARNKSLATGNPEFEREIVLAREVSELQSKKTEHTAQTESAEFYIATAAKQYGPVGATTESASPPPMGNSSSNTIGRQPSHDTSAQTRQRRQEKSSASGVPRQNIRKYR